MADNVWEYFGERKREAERLSLEPDPEDASFSEELGSEGRRGRILMTLRMSDRAYLAVNEVVVVNEGGYVHRESYAYFLIIDGQEYAGWERDPSHDPAEHGHGPDHARLECGRVTFKETVERCWEILSREEELTGDAPDAGPGTDEIV